MNKADFENLAWDAHDEVFGPRARPTTGQLDESATDAGFVSSQRHEANGSTVVPMTQIRPLSQQKERLRPFLPGDAHGGPPYETELHLGKRDLDVNNQMEFSAAPLSPSDDELLDGEGECTVPIAHPKLLATGLCYDIRMRYHSELDPPKQRLDFHPEDPRRIYRIYRALCQAGLYKDPQFNVPTIEKPLERIQARNATAPEICLVHTANHYNFVASTATMTNESLIHLERMHDSIYFNPLTFASALLSTGGAIETCKAVVSGRVKNAIAVIRPPGHHAECNRPMGFCLFDNVSIAAKVCQADYPEACRKVLILDWQGRTSWSVPVQSRRCARLKALGNGIQQAFEQDPNVLYISLHVHEGGNFYPLGPYGDHMHCGAAAGLGKNINIPWPTKGMGDSDYLYAFQQVVMPVAYDFDPDLVIIAAGFDAAAGDPLGGCFVTPTCYAHMTHMLMSLANGKLVVCLEVSPLGKREDTPGLLIFRQGGYDLDSISRSALAVTRTLLGEPPDRIEQTRPTKSGAATVDMIARLAPKVGHGIFEYFAFLPKGVQKEPCTVKSGFGWRASLRSMETRDTGLRRLDALRAYQKQQLCEDFDMMELSVFRERISKSFRHQVLATINYADPVPLIIFFHDPYHHQTGQDPNIGRLTDAELYDTLTWYREWAINADFAIIDVNFPNHIINADDIDELNYDKDYEQAKRIAERNELAIYLWENYIELNPSTAIFFMGLGSPAKEVIHIMNNRETFFQRISGIILFLDSSTPLPSVSDQNTYYLSKWFKQNSLVLVSGDHPTWSENGGTKKPGKRFGAVRQSEVQGGVNDMLEKHREDVVEFVGARMGSGRGR
ncbi:MAG: hypothetical protein Q9221_004877 [Calogaya cf. arnoldii]